MKQLAMRFLAVSLVTAIGSWGGIALAAPPAPYLSNFQATNTGSFSTTCNVTLSVMVNDGHGPYMVVFDNVFVEELNASKTDEVHMATNVALTGTHTFTAALYKGKNPKKIDPSAQIDEKTITGWTCNP